MSFFSRFRTLKVLLKRSCLIRASGSLKNSLISELLFGNKLQGGFSMKYRSIVTSNVQNSSFSISEWPWKVILLTKIFDEICLLLITVEGCQ